MGEKVVGMLQRVIWAQYDPGKIWAVRVSVVCVFRRNGGSGCEGRLDPA